jgi:hypothetical protein
MRWSIFHLIALAILACSCGGGSRGPGTSTPPISRAGLTVVPAEGTVDLPSGLALNLEDLTVHDALGTADVDAVGRFTINTFDEGPILATVKDAGGDDVLLGWFGGSRFELSARSTAEVLLYYYAGLFMAPYEGAGAVLDEVASSAEIGPLEDALLAAIAMGSGTIEQLTSAIADELVAAAASLTSVVQQRGVLIDPVGARSGIAVDSVGFDDVLITNNYRRRAYCWVERLGYTPQGGSFIPSGGAPFEKDISASPGFSSFLDLFTKLGSGLYTPVKVGPVPIPLNPADAYSTTYQITAVGLGLGRGDYDRLTSTQKVQHGIVAIETVFIDIFLSGVLSAALPKSPSVKGSEVAESLSSYEPFKAVARDLALKSPEILEKVLQGDLRGAIGAIVQEVVKKPENIVSFTLLLSTWAQAQLPGLDNANEAISNFLLGFAAGIMTNIDAIGSIADLATQAYHISTSNNADIWEVESTGAKVSLTPRVQVVQAGAFKTFTAVVQDAAQDPNLALSYKWTCGDIGKMLDGNGGNGMSFESASSSVQFIPNPGAEGVTSIDVEVFELDGGAARSLGQARSRVEVLRAKPVLGPPVTSLLRGESQMFTARLFPEPVAAPDQLIYVFSCPEQFGTALRALDKETSVPTIAYQASSELGTEMMTVEVFEVRNGVAVSLGTASSEIRVELRKSVLQAAYQIDVCPSPSTGVPRASVAAVVPVSPPADAKTLRLRGSNSIDPAYWGSSITITASKQADGTWNALLGDCARQNLPDEHFLLSAGTGPATGVPATTSWFESRFSGFDFIIEVTYE